MKKLIIGLVVVMLIGAGNQVVVGQSPEQPPVPSDPFGISGVENMMTFQSDNLPDEFVAVLHRNKIDPGQHALMWGVLVRSLPLAIEFILRVIGEGDDELTKKVDDLVKAVDELRESNKQIVELVQSHVEGHVVD